MREAAGDLEFETAARLRDEIKRLQETELAIADDPFARQSTVDARVAESTGKPAKKAPRRPSGRGRKGP
jgi:excinuclease ABC subunit B